VVHAHPTLQAKSKVSVRVICLHYFCVDARSDVRRRKQLDMAWVGRCGANAGKR